ncbi:WXG100 family type VII secretion target [Homoserinibacter sp. YIM 151385]|uniref:WXG100 family type VII secretion target n=1 Tax=Homoserinibacter sp. YIM 151385 TaxID=2985506 RepID=UPI0022F13E50|nr:WXG100 family type VII secretion target [Homoserinibacter sp. YIM 151385]WBU37857.1 WXG100 family type VII secretion target [Homoserinibacter sp. YIM 151385]
MTRYQVDSEAVVQATATAQATIGRIQQEVGGLHGQLSDLQSSWTGDASAAFQAILADWTATQRRVEESLSGIATALGSAGRQYAEVEQHNARLFLA